MAHGRWALGSGLWQDPSTIAQSPSTIRYRTGLLATRRHETMLGDRVVFTFHRERAESVVFPQSQDVQDPLAFAPDSRAHYVRACPQ